MNISQIVPTCPPQSNTSFLKVKISDMSATVEHILHQSKNFQRSSDMSATVEHILHQPKNFSSKLRNISNNQTNKHVQYPFGFSPNITPRGFLFFFFDCFLLGCFFTYILLYRFLFWFFLRVLLLHFSYYIGHISRIRVYELPTI